MSFRATRDPQSISINREIVLKYFNDSSVKQTAGMLPQ